MNHMSFECANCCKTCIIKQLRRSKYVDFIVIKVVLGFFSISKAMIFSITNKKRMFMIFLLVTSTNFWLKSHKLILSPVNSSNLSALLILLGKRLFAWRHKTWPNWGPSTGQRVENTFEGAFILSRHTTWSQCSPGMTNLIL